MTDTTSDDILEDEADIASDDIASEDVACEPVPSEEEVSESTEESTQESDTSTVASSSAASSPNTQPVTDPDYSQFIFEQERCNYHSDFQSGLSWLQARQKIERAVNLSNVTVNTDGTVTISNHTYTATKFAFEKLCACLGIPRPFARKIPPDLLLDNTARLIQEKIASLDDTLMFHFVTNGQNEILAGVTKEEYVFVDAVDFLTAVAAMDGNGYVLDDLLVSDRMIEADLLIDNVTVTTPTSSAQFSVGVNLRSSDIGDVNPTARLMLKDIGNDVTFVLSTDWGRVDRIRNKKVSVQTTFTNFMGHVREMIIPTTQLEAALEVLDQEDATDVELKNWFDTFNRAIQNREAIDDMLAWTEENRKDMWKQISARRKDNKANRLQGLPVVDDSNSGYNKRDLSKIVSEYANSATFDEREPLRRLGGHFVKLV